MLYKYIFLLLAETVLLTACSKDNINEAAQTDSLELLASYNITVPEPSGLAVNETGTALYTVSDNTAQVYKLSTNGTVIKTYPFVGNDLEGVSVLSGTKLLLAEERTKQIIEYDIGSGNISRHRIDYENNDENNGIEGVAYAGKLNAIFVLNEKNPGKLLRLRSDYSIVAEYGLNFASDYSGIFYDTSTGNLWIVSDQKKTLNKCNLRGDLIESYSVNVNQAEGIAVTIDKIYVVSDAEKKLYIYKKPQE